MALYALVAAIRNITAMKQNDTNARKSQLGVFLIRQNPNENPGDERTTIASCRFVKPSLNLNSARLLHQKDNRPPSAVFA